jgi:dTDP-4-dehydrorhamnose 3,5-epimerase-like enzyme
MEPVSPSMVREDSRGVLIEVVNAGPWETVLTGALRRGGVLGNHYHQRTRMFLFLLEGSADVHLVDVASGRRTVGRLAAGEGTYLETRIAHAVVFREESRFLLLKSHPYQPEDSDTYSFPVFSDSENGS